jgi:hypothetical protein
MNRQSALLLVALPLCLEACASSGSYPSLSRRDAERTSSTAEPAAPSSGLSEAPPPSADLQSNVERLLGQARIAHGEFEANREAAQRAISAARGSAKASESWVAGQVAFASLEAARSGAITALADLDQHYAEERIARPEAVSPSATLLGSARDQIKGWVEEENGVLVGLAQQLGT